MTTAMKCLFTAVLLSASLCSGLAVAGDCGLMDVHTVTSSPQPITGVAATLHGEAVAIAYTTADSVRLLLLSPALQTVTEREIQRPGERARPGHPSVTSSGDRLWLSWTERHDNARQAYALSVEVGSWDTTGVFPLSEAAAPGSSCPEGAAVLWDGAGLLSASASSIGRSAEGVLLSSLDRRSEARTLASPAVANGPAAWPRLLRVGTRIVTGWVEGAEARDVVLGVHEPDGSVRRLPLTSGGTGGAFAMAPLRGPQVVVAYDSYRRDGHDEYLATVDVESGTVDAIPIATGAISSYDPAVAVVEGRVLVAHGERTASGVWLVLEEAAQGSARTVLRHSLGDAERFRSPTLLETAGGLVLVWMDDQGLTWTGQANIRAAHVSCSGLAAPAGAIRQRPHAGGH